eukprot:jgi/Bigna1/81312/fgenesh1_pg.79_\
MERTATGQLRHRRPLVSAFSLFILALPLLLFMMKSVAKRSFNPIPRRFAHILPESNITSQDDNKDSDKKEDDQPQPQAGELSYAEVGAEGVVQVYVYPVEVGKGHRRKGVASRLLRELYNMFPKGPFSLRFFPDPLTKENTLASWMLYRKWAIVHNMRICEINEKNGEKAKDEGEDGRTAKTQGQGRSPPKDVAGIASVNEAIVSKETDKTHAHTLKI